MIAYTHYPSDARVRREAEALSDRHDQVDVVCLRREGEPRVAFLNGVRLIRPIQGRYRGTNAALYVANYTVFVLVASAVVGILNLKRRYHIIHAHTMPDFVVCAGILPKLLGAKVILDVHDLMPELYQSKFGLPSSHWLIALITWVERQSIRIADRAIAVHRPHLEALILHGNPADKFMVLLNAPDPSVFKNGSRHRAERSEGLRLIYHGTVAYRHGLDIAAAAVLALKDEMPDLSLVIVGEGEGIADLARMIDSQHLGDRIELRGFVPLDDLLPILSAADLGIVPLREDVFTRHMLPVKLLEYVRLGIPVICSRTEAVEAYFDDTMVEYFTPGNVNELVACIRRLRRDPARRESLVKNANRFNREYGWEIQRAHYYRLIDELTGVEAN